MQAITEIAQIIWPGVVVYAAIRADLARINERANQAIEMGNKAHSRIDSMMKVGN